MELSHDIKHLAAQLGCSLTNKGFRITTAESCTGGGISYALTDTPGSSAYLERCYVTYSNLAKTEMLGVQSKTLAQFGAVSEQTVTEMVNGAAIAANAEVAIAVSGVAGPDGGTQEKPVGTVWVALKVLDKVTVQHCLFPGGRAEIRLQVIEYSLKSAISGINK